MVGVRFLFGLGEAGAYPNIARALGRWFPFRERATAQSFIWLSSRLGGALAPTIIGGLLVLGGGWQQAFWILGAIGMIWAALFFAWFRDRPEDMPSVNLAECTLIRTGAEEAGSIYDDKSRPPLPWKELLSPNLLALYLASFCVSFSFYFYITFLPKYLKDHLHVDYSQSQLLSGLPLLLGGMACLVGGRLSDFLIRRTSSKRWGRSSVAAIGWGGAGLCALAVSQLNSAAAIMTLICVAFAFQDLGVPSLWSLPTDVGGRYAGTVGGCMNSAGALGGMLSPLVAAQVSIAYGWQSVFFVFGGMYLLGALAWLRIDAGRPILQSTSRAP
jgi:MFS family permease